MKKNTKAVKKRNPQDATLRNVNALKKRIGLIEIRLGTLELCLTSQLSKDAFRRK